MRDYMLTLRFPLIGEDDADGREAALQVLEALGFDTGEGSANRESFPRATVKLQHLPERAQPRRIRLPDQFADPE